MALLQIKDALGNVVYLKASGAGTSGDPLITENTVSGNIAVVSLYKSIVVTPTITAGAYAINTCVGGKLTLSNVMRVSGGSARLETIHITDRANVKPAFTIHIYDSDPTAATLTNGVVTVLGTDDSKIIRTIPVASVAYTSVSSGGTIEASADIDVGKIVTASGSADLYFSVSNVGTPTFTSTSGLIFKFDFIQG